MTRLLLVLFFFLSSCALSRVGNIETTSLSGVEGVVVREDVLRLPGAPKPLRKVILENNEILLSILPEHGGQIYEFIWKATGHNQFYQNRVWRRVKAWGKNACREGGWTPIGGLEFSFPENEHGCVYDQPVGLVSIEKENGQKGVRMVHRPSEATRGMELVLEVTLKPKSKVFEIRSKIINSVLNGDQKYQYWINAMLSPGKEDPQRGSSELLFSKGLEKFRTHKPAGEKYKARTEYPWTPEMEIFNNWKRDILGFFTVTPVDYMALYNRDDNEGVIRVFESPQYVKVWNFGRPLDYKMFSTVDSAYVESWSGISKDFWTDAKMAPGGKLEVVERWIPFSLPKNDANLREAIQREIR